VLLVGHLVVLVEVRAELVSGGGGGGSRWRGLQVEELYEQLTQGVVLRQSKESQINIALPADEEVEEHLPLDLAQQGNHYFVEVAAGDGLNFRVPLQQGKQLVHQAEVVVHSFLSLSQF